MESGYTSKTTLSPSGEMDYGDRNEEDGSRLLDEKISDLDTKPKLMPSQTRQMDENILKKISVFKNNETLLIVLI